MNERKVTLEDLKNNSRNKRTVDTNEIASTMQEKHGVTPPEKPKVYDSYVDEIIDTVGKKASDEAFEQAKDIVQNIALESELGEDQDMFEEEEDDPGVNEDAQDMDTQVLIEDDEDDDVSDFSDIDELSNMDDDFDDDEETMEIIRTKIKEKIKPISDKIDLHSFTISNKPISLTKAFENSESEYVNVADWVLYDTNILISMAEMKGYDIEKLNPRNSMRNEYNTFRDIYSLIYSHIVNEDKPSLEEFLKLIKFTDIPHLYFAIYRASFNKQNIITYTCPNEVCKEVFLETIDIDDMYKFSSKEVEEEFNTILNNNDSTFKGKEYETNLIQISDEYVVGLKEPSIFNVIFESISIPESFRVKYADIIGILSYIDNMYYIDRESSNLTPIKLKVYNKDLGKTMKYKIIQYSKILKTLTSDQYYILTSAIAKANQDDHIQYILPERRCPKCGTTVPESEHSPDSMLFTRHQLGALANI